MISSIISAVFGLSLLGAPQLSYPDPYIGWAFSVFPSKLVRADGSTWKHHYQMFNIGLPIATGSFRAGNIDGNKWIFLPEVAISSDLIFAHAAFGPQFRYPLGYRQIPSAWIIGLQGGFHYAYLSGGYGHENHDFAGLVNFYIAPEFEFFDWYFRIQFNPKLLFGDLSNQSVRTEFSTVLGFLMAINFQVDF